MQLSSKKKNLKKILDQNKMEVINHGISVSNVAYKIAKELGLDNERCYDVAVSGLLHDIGKIRLTSYLNGSDGLSYDDDKYIRLHSKLSYEAIKDREFSDFVLESVLHHHENYNGTGYPDKLKGDEIPLGARILRVSDVYAALLSDRTYRKGFDSDTAIQIMIEEVSNYDMNIFLVFQRVIGDYEEKRFY